MTNEIESINLVTREISILIGVGLGGVLLGILVAAIKALRSEVIQWITSCVSRRRFNLLQNHVFFRDLDNYIDHYIPNIIYQCPFRKKLFTDLLGNMFMAIKEITVEIIGKKLNKMTNAEYESFMLSTVDRTVTLFKEYCEKDGIFDFVIDEYLLTHIRTQIIMKELIREINDSEYIYKNNLEKTIAILHLLSGVYHMALTDSEKAFRKINGRLYKQTYKGKDCMGDTQACLYCQTLMNQNNENNTNS